MQVHEDFILQVDEPAEQFRFQKTRLRGWIAARATLTEVRLRGKTTRSLPDEERPDVRRAFPNYPFVIGFDGEIESDDLRDGSLHFSFEVGGRPHNAVGHLLPAPRPPHGLKSALVRFRRWIELQKLRRARDESSRWNAALAAFLLEINLTRNTDFRRVEADRLIGLFADYFPEACVVQIGANDGFSADPLFDAFARTRWSGLLVEPVPHLFDALAARYRDRPGLRVERVAVSTHDGEAPIFRLQTIPGKTPEWYNHLATLNRAVLLQHRASIPDIESLIIEERTPTARLETLLDRARIERIDLLVIDTEGHDYEILRKLDFERFQPAVLMFEHQHLSTGDKGAAYALLRTHKYEYKETAEGDVIAWRRL